MGILIIVHTAIDSCLQCYHKKWCEYFEKHNGEIPPPSAESIQELGSQQPHRQAELGNDSGLPMPVPNRETIYSAH